ncbi:hypothetical protein LOD99_10050 [Oopsacas minuta]|uniref:Uncharacterized protein n=1 Tax=Oopsacas minuta TaxID=111878 RepID=A0AAV7KKD2_9METZ|nr:hypothetical protein LOD99_10050 [Oopsacas minuta]
MGVLKDTLRHQTMTTPVDVKFTNSEMFVLSFGNNLSIHVFTLSEENSRSLVTRGIISIQDDVAFFFCLERHNNIVISDYSTHRIKVFSPEGDAHTIG